MRHAWWDQAYRHKKREEDHDIGNPSVFRRVANRQGGELRSFLPNILPGNLVSSLVPLPHPGGVALHFTISSPGAKVADRRRKWSAGLAKLGKRKLDGYLPLSQHNPPSFPLPYQSHSGLRLFWNRSPLNAKSTP